MSIIYLQPLLHCVQSQDVDYEHSALAVGLMKQSFRSDNGSYNNADCLRNREIGNDATQSQMYQKLLLIFR